MFSLIGGDDTTAAVEHDKARAGGALIEGT
jgi:hypothetical protein